MKDQYRQAEHSQPKRHSLKRVDMSPSGPPMGSMSPSSSPRLPSPPPFPEVQISPKSPGMNATQVDAMPESENATKLDQGAMRRIRPGTKAADFTGPPLVPLNEVSRHLRVCLNVYQADILLLTSSTLPFSFKSISRLSTTITHALPTTPRTTKPVTRATATEITNPPPNVDRSLWLYELCRLLVMKANVITVLFFREEPPCSASTCPEMRASEWQYLCAVHEPPKSCCAIDYCCHTLEWAADTLTSTKNFPSRLLIGETPGAAQGAVRQLTNIMRRVYRIFAHAWFSHRDVFWQLENDEGLYVLFKTVCDEYHLIPEENYTVPPEAEGLAGKKEENPEAKSLLRKQDTEIKPASEESEDKTTISTGATTRRHKHTPSMGSSVTTIHEGDEDDRGSGSPAKAEPKSLASGLEAVTLQQRPPPDEAPLAEVTKAAEEREPTPVEADHNVQAADNVAGEHDVTAGSTELKREDNEEERPSTAISDSKEPSSESIGAPIKAEETEKASEDTTIDPTPEKIQDATT